MTTEKQEVYIDTELALIQRMCITRGIELSGFARIHDEVIININSLKSGYTDCDIRRDDTYQDLFNVWDDSMTINTRQQQRTVDFYKKELTDYKNLQVFLLDTEKQVPMPSLKDTDLLKAVSNVDTLYRSYLNSHYMYSDVELTLGEYITERENRVTKHLAVVTELMKLTVPELLTKYSYTKEELDTVYAVFERNSKQPIQYALDAVVELLTTDGQERAYLYFLHGILQRYIGGMELHHWFKVVHKMKGYMDSRYESRNYKKK